MLRAWGVVGEGRGGERGEKWFHTLGLGPGEPLAEVVQGRRLLRHDLGRLVVRRALPPQNKSSESKQAQSSERATTPRREGRLVVAA